MYFQPRHDFIVAGFLLPHAPTTSLNPGALPVIERKIMKQRNFVAKAHMGMRAGSGKHKDRRRPNRGFMKAELKKTVF